MMKKFLGAAAVVAFAATTALAAYTPGPLPTGPDTFPGGFVPANPDTFKAEQKASKAGSKLASDTAKCYSKGAKNVSKGKPDGVAACVGTGDPNGKGALDKFAKAIGKVAADLPPCSNAMANGTAIVGLVRGFQPGTYCASPSGAFVDGAAGL
jgi:hypothetical protein